MPHFHHWLPIVVALMLCTHPVRGEEKSPSPVDRKKLEAIDEAVKQAIDKGDIPGAVVLVLHRDETVWRKAYGLRSKQPEEVAMTVDTVFDLASLTKPMATAVSTMLLVESGKLRITDRVAEHLPDFAQNGKEKITVEQLLIHSSGLIADNALADYKDGRATALARICALKCVADPGTKFIYSDVNFILLGELVEKLSGTPLDIFARKHIYEPLSMKETGFAPKEWTSAKEILKRTAPTEKRNDAWMLGEVHDPRAHLLGGVAGHAGLFSTADDLALFARMLLNGGELNGKRILSAAAVRTMVSPRPVPGGLRGLGWDVQTTYSSNRGELFARESGYGHTGFTGTSLWIDPDTRSAVIVLSNRVHPNGKGNATRLRNHVATIAASAVLNVETPGKRSEPSPVATGIDVLVRSKFASLQGRNVGLVTNHTGVNSDGQSTIDLLHKAAGLKLIALFSPEHGIRGEVDAKVADAKDEKTGLPIVSLYGERNKPRPEQLKGIDTLVFDIQDAGCRFYTYISTLGLILEAAGENKIKVVVLDRPNPLGGTIVEGPVLDAGKESFVAYHRLPIRHGMTVGELAKLFNAERKLGVDLEVITMEGWRRDDFYDRTGLTWINPSPNLRSPAAALLYPGIGLLETTNLSVGRGTQRPFEWIGAPWLDGKKLAAALIAQNLPGVRFVSNRQTPTSSIFKGEDCGGVQIFIDWSCFQPIRTGLSIALELHRLYPTEWKIDRLDRLLGRQATVDGVKAGKAFAELEKEWQKDLEEFRAVRKKYLLYP